MLNILKSLLKKILRSLFNRLFRTVNWFKFSIKQFFRFILPNFRIIITKRIIYSEMPVCNQKLLVTGLGKVEIGAKCTFGYKLGGRYFNGLVELQPIFPDSKIIIGNDIFTNNNLFISAGNLIKIGDDTLIGQGVTIIDMEAHGIDPTKRRQIGEIGKVIIGRNVWLGNNVTILKNSEIGDNTIVAAGAVVAGKFPTNTIIGGVPAKVIREI